MRGKSYSSSDAGFGNSVRGFPRSNWDDMRSDGYLGVYCLPHNTCSRIPSGKCGLEKRSEWPDVVRCPAVIVEIVIRVA